MRELALELLNIKLGAVKRRDDFAMVSLTRKTARSGNYQLLSDSLRNGSSVISEISEAGVVHEVDLVNDSNQPVLILDGEELIGAKQNRISNFTVLAHPQRTTRVPVSCVEQGRWSWMSPTLRTSGELLFPRARTANVRYARTFKGVIQSDPVSQLDIWNSIESESKRAGLSMPISSITDLYRCYDSHLTALTSTVVAEPFQVGAAFFWRKNIIGIEIFGNSQTLGHQLPKLVRSYGLEIGGLSASSRVQNRAQCAANSANDHSTEETDSTLFQGLVAQFLSTLVKEPGEKLASCGAGYHVRTVTSTSLASALILDDSLVHFAAFPEEGGAYLRGRIALDT